MTLPHLKEAKSSSKLFYILCIYWLHWVSVALCRLSLAVTRGYSLVALHGPLVAVASLAEEHRLWALGPQELRHAGSVVVAQGLAALWHVEPSQTRDQTCVPWHRGQADSYPLHHQRNPQNYFKSISYPRFVGVLFQLCFTSETSQKWDLKDKELWKQSSDCLLYHLVSLQFFVGFRVYSIIKIKNRLSGRMFLIIQE